jgi:hypothetical protein
MAKPPGNSANVSLQNFLMKWRDWSSDILHSGKELGSHLLVQSISTVSHVESGSNSWPLGLWGDLSSLTVNGGKDWGMLFLAIQLLGIIRRLPDMFHEDACFFSLTDCRDGTLLISLNDSAGK